MKAFRLFYRLVFFCAVVALVLPARGAASNALDERDREVLESLTLHLLADAEFDATRVPPTNGTSILLHARTMEKTGFLMHDQIRSDIGDHSLSSDLENNIRQRNTPADAKPGTYDSVMASLTNLTFAPGIVVVDFDRSWGKMLEFEKTYLAARGWLQAYLPGYSADGKVAVVRAAVGPLPHGAMLTAVLEKSGEKWMVKWYNVARFA